MTDAQLYELSSNTNNLLVQAKSLLKLHLLRYRLLVDGSVKGYDCTYARITRNHFIKEHQAELNTLLDMRETLNSIINKLEAIDYEAIEAEDSI